MGKICSTLGARDFVKTGCNCLAEMPDGIGGPLEGVGGDFAKNGFELGEQLFDGVEIRTVGGEIDKIRTTPLNGLTNACNFVHTDVVHEDNVTASQSRNENLFDIGLESFAVHGSFEEKRGSHAIMAQRSDECGGLPVAVQHLLDQSPASRRATVKAGDVGGNAGFIDENQPFWIESGLSALQRL